MPGSELPFCVDPLLTGHEKRVITLSGKGGGGRGGLCCIRRAKWEAMGEIPLVKMWACVTKLMIASVSPKEQKINLLSGEAQ